MSKTRLIIFFVRTLYDNNKVRQKHHVALFYMHEVRHSPQTHYSEVNEVGYCLNSMREMNEVCFLLIQLS